MNFSFKNSTIFFIFPSKKLLYCINRSLSLHGGIYYGKGESFPTMGKFFVCIRSNVEHNFIIDSQH